MNERVPPRGATEVALLRRAAAGEAAAFRELVELHEDHVYRLALGLLGDPTGAEDAAQETFVRLYRSLDSFRGDAQLSTWLHRVTVNLCHDARRRSARSDGTIDLDSAEPRLALVDSGPEARLERAEQRERIQNALERVTPEQREAIVMRYLSEMSYAEIAGVTGVSANTVASRVYRGLERLGQILTGPIDEKEVS